MNEAAPEYACSRPMVAKSFMDGCVVFHLDRGRALVDEGNSIRRRPPHMV